MNNSIFITIKKLKNYADKYVVSLPLEMFNTCQKVFEGRLKIGFIKKTVLFVPNTSSNNIEMSESLLKSINLGEGIECNAIFSEDILSLGPVIAVYTSNGTIRKANTGKVHFRLQELIKANRKSKNILYFFSIKDVNFIDHKINGVFFNLQKGVWEKKYFPFPDVFYDRGGGTLKKQKIISKYIRKQFDNMYDLKKINPQYFFDKWDVYVKLSSQDKAVPYLPLTKLYTNSKDLKELFNLNNTIYAKDCLGSNGRKVMRITKLDNGTYEYKYFKEKIIQERLTSFNELIDKMNSFFKKKKVIIQSAIDLIKINNKSVDLRATVNRDGEDNIRISAYPVRLGKSGSPVTSTKSGSKVYRFEDFFMNTLSYSKDEIKALKDRIDKFLIDIYQSVENSYGKFGEIGIDFAIDKNEMIWFIECNSKPGKDTLFLSYDQDTIEKAFLNPLEYGKFIAKF